VEERTERGRAFHADAAADWKDRSPMVERIVRGTIRSEDEAERSRWRVYVYRKRTATKMSGTLAVKRYRMSNARL